MARLLHQISINRCGFALFSLGPLLWSQVLGYGSADTALTRGTMLRECLRYEDLHILVANSPAMFQKLVEVVQVGSGSSGDTLLSIQCYGLP